MSEYNEFQTQSGVDAGESKFTFGDIIHMILGNWYWYVLSIAFFLACGVLYLLRTSPVYQRNATVLVKDARKGSGTEVLAFNDIMSGMTRRSVDNELYIFQSRRLMEQVVKKHNLSTIQTCPNKLRTMDLYGREPLLVEFITAGSEDKGMFHYTITKEGKIVVSNFYKAEKFRTVTTPGDTISTPMGNIVMRATPYFEQFIGKDVTVTKMPLNNTIESYRKRLHSDITSKTSSVILFTMNDVTPRRAEDVINGIIDAYDNDAIQDKRIISDLTAKFITERLSTLSEELNTVDSNIASFKQENRIYSPENEAQLSTEQIKKLKEQQLSYEANLEIAKYIYEYINSSDDKFSLIPASTVVASGANTALASQIDSYNTNVLNYQRLLSEATSSNPIVVELAQQIEALREAIISSLNSHIKTLSMHIEHINREQQFADDRMTSSPVKEKEMLSIARQQKVKQELYLYLLTKLEENALTGATAESNARIIDRAYGSDRPISPRMIIIMLIMTILGCVIPFAITYLRESLNNTVRTRRELEKALTIPFVGEIPLYSGKTSHSIIVKTEANDSLSEAFRMLRANLSFMSLEKQVKVIMLTSSVPGSGKTFVSLNLAASLAGMGQRVLVIDLDLRRRTLSKQMRQHNNRRGVTSYISGRIDNLSDIIFKSETESNLDFIFSGPQPPNPTELLMSKQMAALIAELRTMYDYIIIDSVPAMTVADAMIIDPLVDLSLYIIRYGHLDRRLLPDVERLYREKKFHNMGIILNGVEQKQHSYGYGYGYGYGHDENTQKSFWKRLFSQKK